MKVRKEYLERVYRTLTDWTFADLARGKDISKELETLGEINNLINTATGDEVELEEGLYGR